LGGVEIDQGELLEYKGGFELGLILFEFSKGSGKTK
jgi:hypothetical protein